MIVDCLYCAADRPHMDKYSLNRIKIIACISKIAKNKQLCDPSKTENWIGPVVWIA